jgi:hypothetical protein
MSHDTYGLERLAHASRIWATPKPWIAGSTRQRFCIHAPSPVLLCPDCLATIQRARLEAGRARLQPRK